jgi:hypothetical protein
MLSAGASKQESFPLDSLPENLLAVVSGEENR